MNNKVFSRPLLLILTFMFFCPPGGEGGQFCKADCDGDGYNFIQGDCNPYSGSVYPGRTTYSSYPIDGSYDLNCNGVIEKEVTVIGETNEWIVGDCGLALGNALNPESTMLAARQAGL